MKLKKAALLALIGTILATVFLTFIMTTIRVLRGLAPLVMLFPWFAYAFACLSVAVFFYVFHGTVVTLARAAPIQSSPQESRPCLARYHFAERRMPRMRLCNADTSIPVFELSYKATLAALTLSLR